MTKKITSNLNISQLPIEILLQINSYILNDEFWNDVWSSRLSQTCKHMNTILSPVLFSCIRVNAFSRAAFLKLFELGSFSRLVCSNVEVLNLREFGSVEILEVLCSKDINERLFTLNIDIQESWKEFIIILETNPVKFQNLRELRINGAITPNLIIGLKNFLESHPLLEVFEFDGILGESLPTENNSEGFGDDHSGAIRLLADTLPSLTSLKSVKFVYPALSDVLTGIWVDALVTNRDELDCVRFRIAGSVSAKAIEKFLLAVKVKQIYIDVKPFYHPTDVLYHFIFSGFERSMNIQEVTLRNFEFRNSDSTFAHLLDSLKPNEHRILKLKKLDIHENTVLGLQNKTPLFEQFLSTVSLQSVHYSISAASDAFGISSELHSIEHLLPHNDEALGRFIKAFSNQRFKRFAINMRYVKDASQFLSYLRDVAKIETLEVSQSQFPGQLIMHVSGNRTLRNVILKNCYVNAADLINIIHHVSQVKGRSLKFIDFGKLVTVGIRTLIEVYEALKSNFDTVRLEKLPIPRRRILSYDPDNACCFTAQSSWFPDAWLQLRLTLNDEVDVTLDHFATYLKNPTAYRSPNEKRIGMRLF